VSAVRPDRRIEVYTVPPRPGHPLTKLEAGYIPRGPFSCRTCSHFEHPARGILGKCKPVGGPVEIDACCDYWNDPHAPSGAGKAGCEYVRVPGANYTCAECRYFDPNRSRCWPVLGVIAPQASCNKWTP
jgi:hypothetical protein